MHGDDRIEDVGQLILVFVDVVDIRHPSPVERLEPLAACPVELAQPGLQRLHPLADRLALRAQAGEEGPVLLLEPGLELGAIARAVLEIADDHVIERRQGLAERHRMAQRAAEVGRLPERVRGQGDVRAVQAVDDPAAAVVAVGGDHATHLHIATTGRSGDLSSRDGPQADPGEGLERVLEVVADVHPARELTEIRGGDLGLVRIA